jgi:ribosomal protein S18 acetylase RimI-like enzyme
MASASLEIVRCPRELTVDAMSLVLCDIAPSQRREIAGQFLQTDAADPRSDGPFVALRGAQLCGAVWGQHQPGNTALLWLPQLVTGENVQTAVRLAEAAVAQLDRMAVGMSQVILPARDTDLDSLLTAIGFRYLADLMYLTCEAERFAGQLPASDALEFEAYDNSQRGRLAGLIERTYEDTLDCADLNGTRSMRDVINGYQATGMFRDENWLFVRSHGEDVGVLLLADHPQARHVELIYMGLVPEARGRGWGRCITQHAQRLARRANVERIVLAVDAANEPALRMYRAAGFESWDQRAVYVRFCR